MSEVESRMEELIEKVEAAEASSERVLLLKELGALSRNEADDPEGALEAYTLALCDAPSDLEIVTSIEELATEYQGWQSVIETAWEEASESPAESAELLRQLADWYENRLDSKEGARQCYALILEHAPDDSDARQAHLRLLQEAGDWRSALKEIDEQVQDASRQRRDSLMVRAAEIVMFELGDDEAAKARIAALDDKAPQKRKLQTRLFERNNDFEGLLALLQSELEGIEGRARAEVLAQIGILQEEAFSDRDAAKENYQQALALDADQEDAKAGLTRLEAHYAGLSGGERLDYLRSQISAARGKQDWPRAIEAQEELLAAQPGEAQETALDDLLAEAGEFERLEARALSKFEKADSLLKKASIKHALADRFRKAQEKGQEPDEKLIWSLYEEAFALDPKHALRAMRLADRALSNEDKVGALRFFEAAVRESDQLSKEEAVRASMQAADIARDLGRQEKEQTLLVKALIHRGDDAELMLRLADLSYALGEIDEAGEYYGGWLKTGQDQETLARARERRAEALIGQGDGVGALVLLQKLPKDMGAARIDELRAKAHESAQRWAQAVDAWKAAAAGTEDPERKCERLLHAAQLVFTKQKDAETAEALIREADPNLEQRAARSQLMSVLARSEKWEGLYDLLAIQAQHAQSDRERAQFEKTAGFVALEKLKNSELAGQHFENSLQAIAEQGDVRVALDSLRPAQRIKNMAQTESERSASAEASYPEVPRAAAVPDLSTMGLAEATSTAEHVMLEAKEAPEPVHDLPPRGKTALSTARFLDEELWQEHILYEEQDVFLTMLFAVITPAVMEDRRKEFNDYGIDESGARDPERDTSPIAQTLHYVASLAQLPLPMLYSNPRSGGGLEFLHTVPPAMGVGSGAQAGGPGQALAFVAARALSFYRPGHYLRELVAGASDLRAWLLAAIRLSRPEFAAPDDLEGAVAGARFSLDKYLPETSKKVLAELCTKLLQNAPALDLKRWATAVDLSADRIGFIVADDLEMATALIGASPAHASVLGNKERIEALTAYAKSHRYHTLREKLGLVK